jgi:hypothetical protein
MNRFARAAAFAATTSVLALTASAAQAGETRGWVVSWFYPSAAADVAEVDCPKGTTPDAATTVIGLLKEQGKAPAEIEKIMEDFPNNIYTHIGQRGRIDGKPVSPYTNPTSVPDPMMRTVEGKRAFGFNLDGKVDKNDFTDPQTGEKGVDNQFFRAWGCMGVMRAEPGVRPSWPSIQWNTVQQQMPAWLIEVSNIDDIQNDPDVTVRIVQATTPIVLDANSDPQADMTFHEDANPVTKNTVRAAIKDGMLTTDSFFLSLNGHRWAWSEMRMHDAKFRMKIEPNGTAKGFVGGFQAWAPIYTRVAEGGAGYEGMLSMNLPGQYYALRKFADADPDPKTGMNLSISAVFNVEAVPAFIVRNNAQTAQASK